MSELAAMQLRQARQFARDGDVARSIQSLEKARVLAGDDAAQQAEILEALALAYAKSGRSTEAATARDELSQLAPVPAATPAKPVRSLEIKQRSVSRQPSGARGYLIGGVAGLIVIGGLLAFLLHHGAAPKPAGDELASATPVVAPAPNPATVATVAPATLPSTKFAPVISTVVTPPPLTTRPATSIVSASPVIGVATRPVAAAVVPATTLPFNGLSVAPLPRPRVIAATRPVTPATAPVVVVPIVPKPDRQQLLKETVGLCMVVVHYEGPTKDGNVKIDLPLGSGTAFAVSSSGLMLTNRHVVEISEEEKMPENLAKAKMPNVTYRGISYVVCFGPEPKDRYVAKLLHRSEQYDMAILKIKHHFAFPLTIAASPPRQGDDILVCGFPAAVMEALNYASNTHAKVIDLTEKWKKTRQVDAFDGFAEDAFDSTLTKGIVSAPSRNVDGSRYIQIDAVISPGNSGGPVLNVANEVLGIATWGLRSSTTQQSGANYNFALSVGQLAEELQPYLKN